MKKFYKYFLLLILISSCNAFYHPVFLDLDVPDGPPEFQAGWRDGCRSALASGRTTNSGVYDVTFGSGIYQHDKVYQSGWEAAFSSCVITAGKTVQTGIFTRAPFD